MDFTSNYKNFRQNAYKKKKTTGDEFTDEFINALDDEHYQQYEDLAPVKKQTQTTTKTEAPVKEEKDDKKWYDGFLQLGDALSDGYQFGDITKTLLGTDTDIATNAISGVVGWGEDVLDAGATLASRATGALGMKDTSEKLRQFAETDQYDAQEVSRKILSSNLMSTALGPLGTAVKTIFTLDDWLNSKEVDNGFGGTTTVREDNSILGDTSDSMIQSAGEIVAKKGLQMATGGIPIADIITGVTVFGNQAEQALKEDATLDEAIGSGLISAGAEIIFEKLSDGIKFGNTTLDGKLTKLISDNISKIAVRNGVHLLKDIAGESLEEVATEFFSRLGTALYKEEDLSEILGSEEAINSYIQSAITGGLMGGGFSGSKAIGGWKGNYDYKTGLTNTEQTDETEVADEPITEETEPQTPEENVFQNEMEKLTEQTENTIPEEAAVEEVAEEKQTSSPKDLMDIAKQARRENFHGAYTENGKQYLSDGSFVAEFNTVDESLEQRADFPGKIATQEIAEAFERPAQGNFDIHETEDGYVKVGNSVFDSKYVNAMVRAFDNPKFSIAKHRGGHDVLLVTGDNGRAVLMPVEAGENVNVAYEAQELAPTAENTYPEDFAPITEDEANALSEENLASITDADAPDEAPAPYYESENIDPFEDREMKEVSKDRKVNAYQYDNPEVKPFFQEEANILLGELQRTQKPETIYNGDLKYGMTYEAAQNIPDIYRTPRMTTESIEYLRDTVGMSYADIEKGLKAIIEDKGAENIAAAKKIEFHINDRLIHGYTADGLQIPPNQDYVNLLEAKHNEEKGAQVTAQGEEAAEYLTDDLAPAKKTPDLFETSGSGQMSFFEKPKTEKVTADVAPAKETAKPKEAYEAIRPEKPKAEPTPEPRMKRVDSANNAPDGMEERRWYETSTSSKAVDGIVTPDEIPDEVRYYKVKANKDTLAAANNRLARDGYAKSREYFEGRMSEKKLTVEDIALGERLIQEAAKAGDAKAVRELIIDVSILGTELGQRVQALSMIRRLTPEGQLRALHRVVERGKTKGDTAFDGVEITDEMTETILETVKEDGTFDQKELDRAVEDVKQQIADQMKVTKMDKVNAWRYLAMLGNPKTHGRNIISNVAMFGTRVMKNAVARSVEDIALHNRKTDLNTEDIAPIANDADAANRTKDNGQVGMFKPANPTRTRTWRRASEAVKAFAKQTTIEEKANITGESKYSDEGSIKSKRQIFKNKALNAVDTFNKNAMEAEDWWFSKTAYQQTLQEYLTANGVKTEADIKNNPELVNKAKDYALAEAQRATFRQDSFVANKIAEIERKNPVYGAVIGSTMPFKKTPINIAKTGLAYSPLGIARNIYDAVQVKKGNMDASEAIDHVAQTFTGSALAMLGFVLADFGILNGAGEDDKEGDYDYQLGKQSYSFTFGGDTYSLSWLSPVAMPLFVGANAYETLVDQKEWDANVVFDTLGKTLDPLSEMSFLSSLDDVLTSYDSGADRIFGMAGSMAQNYATQFIPTLLSQIASTFDDTKRSTKASKDSGFAFGEETLNKMIYKIPGLRNTLEPTTDIWGNEVKQTENFFARGFESFFSPANKRAGIYTAVDEEIKDLYRQTDDVGVIPSIPYNYINYDGEKYEMSASEHTEYKKLYGQTAYDLMSKLFDTNTYKNATSEERADMVNRVYDYARDEAKREYFSKYDVEYTNSTKDGAEVYKENTIKGAIEADMPVEEYTFYKENPGKYRVAKAVGGYSAYKTYQSELYDINADKDENGKSINGSRKEKVIDYVNNLDADYGTKIILFKSEYKADDTYNYDIIDYLNNREDISYEEMVTILKELDFTVHSDGRVTWD